MKQIAVLSGKGGTGKTSLTACFAVLAKKAVVVDCDVDAPDLHLLLHPQILQTQQFMGSKLAVIDETKCIKCGLCRKLCRFDALTEDLKVDSIACEGCGVCGEFCTADAITLTERVSGSAFISKTQYGFMSHALLYPGEANSGKLVTLVRQNAKKVAQNENLNLVLIDGSPGIGCPVIASITGVDAALVVTEPTMSGIHDLQRILGLLAHFKVAPMVCVNMCDINTENTQQILDFCMQNNVPIVGLIQFNPEVTKAMINGKPILEYSPKSSISNEITRMWAKITSFLEVKES
jgi:MinD superfamily P-loop ATPase